jgi:two-component system sensor histidine kinase MprB
MEALIGDLLSAARAESGALTRERVEVSPIVGRVAERLAKAAAAKDASVEVRTGEDAVILGDAQSIERALRAIGHNAVRYAPAGGSVVLSVNRSDRAVEISVQDSGAGFSANALEHALERFWREPGAPAGSGTGLGLAIARSIVEANHGTIVLANAAGGGALVRLQFPAASR